MEDNLYSLDIEYVENMTVDNKIWRSTLMCEVTHLKRQRSKQFSLESIISWKFPNKPKHLASTKGIFEIQMQSHYDTPITIPDF